jgi:hypothetical protein
MSRKLCEILRLLFMAAKKSIPRGHRKNYVPCWSAECDRLLEEYKASPSDELANRLIIKLDEGRRSRWMEAMEKLDFTHSSRKSWNLLHRLSGTARAMRCVEVSSDEIADVIEKHSSIAVPPKVKSQIKRLLRKEMARCEEKSSVAGPVIPEEVTAAIGKVKLNKAPGVDGVMPEFIRNLGPRAIIWLSKLFSQVIEKTEIPKTWKQSKVMAVLKPGKDPKDPKSYRPIALLSVTYKLFERVLLSRVGEKLDKCLPVEQAGFRKGRSCEEQVLGLNMHIEHGFEKNMKTAAVFLDLSAAYDTVWRNGLLLKLSRILGCRTMVNLFRAVLSGRTCRVYLNGEQSSVRTLQNGLPQGSVLSPILFNVYTADLPTTKSRKFIYADDIGLVAQENSFEGLENTLNKDLQHMEEYFQKWYLKPNPTKTVSTAFHLNNREAQRTLNVTFCSKRISHQNAPRYLGVRLDRALTYRQHLEGLRDKLKTRLNIIGKLAGTTWGCDMKALRTSCLALLYSTGEYCSSVWARSAHVSKVDRVLNEAMRKISGTLRPTETEWLPVLSNIMPPDLRRLERTGRVVEQLCQQRDLPVSKDIHNPPPKRLKSRNYVRLDELNRCDGRELWRERWAQAEVKNRHLITDPNTIIPGTHLNRKEWCCLNRFRTSTGRCAEATTLWGFTSDSHCECGQIQTMDHLVSSCPVYSFSGGLGGVHDAGEQACQWLHDVSEGLQI